MKRRHSGPVMPLLGKSRSLGTDFDNINPPSRNQEFYDAIAYEYDRSYHSNNDYTYLRTQLEIEFIISNMVRSGRTLEIGPGQGRLTQHLADNSHSVVAADVSKKMLDICQARTKARNVSYHHADLFHLDKIRLGHVFDTIVCMWVIPHLADGELAIRKLLPLLKPDGRIIFDLWNSSSLRKLQIVRSNEKQLVQPHGSINRRDWVYTRYYTYDEMVTLSGQLDLTMIDEYGWCLLPLMNCRGRRFLFPLYKLVDKSLQSICKKYYYSRLFCCTR